MSYVYVTWGKYFVVGGAISGDPGEHVKVLERMYPGVYGFEVGVTKFPPPIRRVDHTCASMYSGGDTAPPTPAVKES